MPQWVQTDHEFSDHIAWLTVSSRLVDRWLSLRSLAESKDIEEIRKVLCDALDELRPDLMGCNVLALKYELYRLSWEILVSHRSLPPVPRGDYPPRLPLIEDQPI